VDVRHGSDPSPVSPWRGEPWRRIATAVRDGLGDEIVTTPYIQLGASDSRWFTEISDNVYRFTPFHLTRAERDALHSHNERIRVGVWLRASASTALSSRPAESGRSPTHAPPPPQLQGIVADTPRIAAARRRVVSNPLQFGRAAGA
jgi:hypothetical protein